jgi:hypothetical protein
MRELEAAAPDIRMVGSDQFDDGVGAHRRAGLGDRLTGDANLTGQDHRSRPFAGRDEAAVDEQLVQAHTHAPAILPSKGR